MKTSSGDVAMGYLAFFVYRVIFHREVRDRCKTDPNFFLLQLKKHRSVEVLFDVIEREILLR